MIFGGMSRGRRAADDDAGPPEVRNALLEHDDALHAAYQAAGGTVRTDWWERARRLRAGEPVAFLGSELPEPVRRARRLALDGYYSVDAADRVTSRSDYP